MGQLDFTTISKSVSSKSVHVFDTTPLSKSQTFVCVTFALACYDWQQVPFVLAVPLPQGRTSGGFHKKALTFAQLPPASLRALKNRACAFARTLFCGPRSRFAVTRCPMTRKAALSNSSFIILSNAIIITNTVSCLNHILSKVFLSHGPCWFLV